MVAAAGFERATCGLCDHVRTVGAYLVDAFHLVRAHFELTVVPLWLLLFTVALVHGWYIFCGAGWSGFRAFAEVHRTIASNEIHGTVCTVNIGSAEHSPKRTYHMSARAEAVAQTRERILRSAYDLWLERPYHEVTMEAVAKAAGVGRQTIVRQFATKDDLAVAVVDWQRPREDESRSAEPGDVPTAISRLIDRYEAMGDANVRLLELEGRVDAIDYLLAQARQGHRAWIENTLAPRPARIGRAEREHVVLSLYAATDVTLWKLLRRDLGRSRSEVEAIVRRLVDGVLNSADSRRGPKITAKKEAR